MKKIKLLAFFLILLISTANYAEKKSANVYTHQSTQLKFPANLNGLVYTNLVTDKQHHELGVTLNYSNKEIHAEVSVYNLGLTKINPAALDQEFENNKQAIGALESSGQYKNVEQIKNQPPFISIGNTKFHYAMFTYLTAGKISYDQAIAELFLTEYKQHFIKVKVISSQENQQKSVDNFIKGLKTLMH